jgi:hypothetical protein
MFLIHIYIWGNMDPKGSSTIDRWNINNEIWMPKSMTKWTTDTLIHQGAKTIITLLILTIQVVTHADGVFYVHFMKSTYAYW